LQKTLIFVAIGRSPSSGSGCWGEPATESKSTDFAARITRAANVNFKAKND
jgi:hypothetical protein